MISLVFRNKVRLKWNLLNINQKGRFAMAEEKLQQSDEIASEEQLIARFEKFGTTPSRTRLKIKVRDWDRKQRLQSTAVRSEER